MTDENHQELRLEETPIDEYLEIPDILGGEDGDYIVQVNGVSFDRLAILEGDYLVVRPTIKPEKGAVAVVVAFPGGGDTTLTVHDPAEDLPSGAKLCGQVIGVIRKV